MATLNDRARDFWDRISPRERRLVVIAAIAVPITLAIWLGLAIHDGLAEREARNDRMRRAIAKVADLHAKGQTQAPEEDPFPKNGVEIKLNTYLTDAANKAGFKLKGTTPRPQITRNGFTTNSVSCAVDKLTIEQLKNFLQEIEAKKIVAITHLDIRRDFRDKDKLNATLEVSTYAREQVKADGSAGSGAGSGQGG